MSPRFTPVEQRIDEWAHRRLDGAPVGGVRANLVEFLVFVLKQAWACVFGVAILAVIVLSKLYYPDGIALARNDFLVIAAVAIQVAMVALRLETLRELRVIILFHLVGTGMELFKTAVGSWLYTGDGILHIAGVPLYSGFMYAAIGSYMVRVYRLFDLRFVNYPPRWVTAILALAIYVNFFSHHYIPDARYVLVAATFAVFGLCRMQFRVFRRHFTIPQLVTFVGVALFIWIAENVATWGNAWQYPNQQDGWQLVSIEKLVSWFLLMIVSVVLVAWVYPPRPPDDSVTQS
ncbi:MAG: DUF817 domain-containing protein [Rhodoglobus sp.]